MLEIRNLTAGYGKLLILHDLHLDVPAGQFVAILGPNGSGKSTLLKTIFGLTDVSAGTVAWRGQALLGQPTQRLNELGLAYVPQRENVFRSLTVRDNLLLAVRRPGRRGAGRGEPDGASSLDGKGGGAGWGEPDGKGGGARPPGATLEACLARFPILRKRQAQPAGQLSGGERQLLAIALGWLAHPTLMLLDEPSAGLSPLFVTEVFQTLKTLCAGGITLVVVEQNARSILRWCDAAVVLREGQVVFQGTADAVLADAATVDSYLGVGARRPAP